MTPLATIAIPTYNRARSLRRAVDSALTQVYRETEIIISDNASTDETASLCRQYAATDGRVRYLRQDQNIGPTGNFNAVLGAARGEFFMWLADDDWLDSNYVSSCVAVLREDSSIVSVSGRGQLYTVPAIHQQSDLVLSLLHPSPEARLLAYYAQVTYNSLFYGLTRTELVRAAGLEKALAGDWTTVAYLAMRGKLMTTEKTNIHRMAGGASESFGSTIRTLRLPSHHAWMPRVVIAFAAARSSYTSAILADRPRPMRIGLATELFVILMLRFSWMRRFIPRRFRTRFIARYY